MVFSFIIVYMYMYTRRIDIVYHGHINFDAQNCFIGAASFLCNFMMQRDFYIFAKSTYIELVPH